MDAEATPVPSSVAFARTLPHLPAPHEMQAWDEACYAMGIPGPVLMENASREALRVLRLYVPDLAGKRIALFMGAGNNGGDAACLARHLADCGASPVVWHFRPLDRARGDAALNVRLAQACGIPFRPASEWDGEACDVVVDGLLGTGFQGTLRGDLALLVERINAFTGGGGREHGGWGRRPFVLAIDIPSGLDGLTGRACPVAVRSDATATFAAPKPGLVLPCAHAWTGVVHSRSIGTPLGVRESLPCSYRLLSSRVLEKVARPVPGGFKNSYGHVLVVGGGKGLEGAAQVAALAALRAGAGLVTAAAPAGCVDAVKGARPEIMTRPLGNGVSWPRDLAAAGGPEHVLARATALVVGPGLGRSEDARAFVKALLSAPQRPAAVVDADALVLLAGDAEALAALREDDVLTPHPGEAAALLGCSAKEIQADRFASVRRLAALCGACVVLKGAGSLVAQRGAPILVSPADVPQLACAGSGDALAGVVGALLARIEGGGREGMRRRCMPALQAAATGVAWHCAAGRELAEDWPFRGCLASEIADALPRALARTSGNRGNEGKNAPCDVPATASVRGEGVMEEEGIWML